MKAEPERTAARPVFISRAGADADFAALVGAILENAGYTVILQQWDFANRNFIERMHAALAEGARVVALLSPEYLRSEHCQAEWQNAIVGDPLNVNSRLVLLRVVECQPPGLLGGIAYWDLVPIRDNRPILEEIVLDAVRADRRDAAPSGAYWRAPQSIVDAEAIRPVSGFSGREAELAELDVALGNEGSTAAVFGLGGVGKSSVARQFAWRNRERYSLIWWLGAQTEDTIVDGILRLGSLFVRGLDQIADRRTAAQQVTSSVLTGFSKPVLLIFDNLEDENLLHKWRPRTGSCALATSRSTVWSSTFAAIPLQAWDLETAVGYLQKESRRADLTQTDAREISEALGALPLAVAHAAASLRGMRMVTPRLYLERITGYLKAAPAGAEYPHSVFATFSAAISHAENDSPGAAAVLRFCASFAADAIPDELFRQTVERYPEELQPAVADGMRLDAALGALDRLSLLAFSQSSRAYGIHRLVQLAARDAIGSLKSDWSESAVDVAEAAFPTVELATWPQCERLLPHARAALDRLPRESASSGAARLAYRCAIYLCERGEYDSAESLQVRALAIFEKLLGPEDLDVASSLYNLASIYYNQGRYADAESALMRALATREKLLGSDHPDVGIALGELALLHHRQSRFDEQESLHKRALSILEKALGPDHPQVATALGHLGKFTVGKEGMTKPLWLTDAPSRSRRRHLDRITPTLPCASTTSESVTTGKGATRSLSHCSSVRSKSRSGHWDRIIPTSHTR